MHENPQELHLKGVPLSEGVSIGKLFFLSEEDPDVFPAFSINTDEVGPITSDAFPNDV